MAKRAFPLWSFFWKSVAVQCQPWPPIQQAMSKEEAPWRCTGREQVICWYLPRILPQAPDIYVLQTFWATHGVFILTSPQWTQVRQINGRKVFSTEYYAARNSIAYQFLMNKYLQVFVLYLLYDTLHFFCLLNISSYTSDAWPKWDAEALFN